LIELGAWPAIFKFDIAAHFPTEFRQASFKGSSLSLTARIVGKKPAHQHCDAPFLLARLRAGRAWQCGPNRNSFDEIASSHCLPQGLGPRQLCDYSRDLRPAKWVSGQFAAQQS
jgi:hypothetical protein